MPETKPVKLDSPQSQTQGLQIETNSSRKRLKWILALLGVVIFGGLFGAGVYGILHSFDLFGGPATQAELIFNAMAPIGLFGGAIYFIVLSVIFSKHPDPSTYFLKSIGNFILFVLLSLVFAFIVFTLLNSQQAIERLDEYFINKNETQRQDTIDKTKISITFNTAEVVSYPINEEFAAIIVKGELTGLLSVSQIPNYMNILAMQKLVINGVDVSIPKPDQWSNLPSSITLGTDEPPKVNFDLDTQEINLLVIVPASSLNTKSTNDISGEIAIWSQSGNTFEQEVLWSQEITSTSQVGKNSTVESVLNNYLQYRK